MPALTLDSAPTGEQFVFATSARGPAKAFTFRWTLAEGKTGPNEHVHPYEDEHFDVVSGTLRVWIDGVARDYGPGESVTVPAGAPHRFLSLGPSAVVADVRLNGDRMEAMFLPAAAWAAGGGGTMTGLAHLLGAMPGASEPVHGVDRWVLAGFRALLWPFRRALPFPQRWDEAA
jgi:mannose-6-phosphate isomerase-like protein (cupin superfamily)